IDAGIQVDSRLESEGADARDVGDEGAHLARPVLAGDVGRDRFVEFSGEPPGQIADLGGLTGADVEDLPVRTGITGNQQVSTGDVFDEDEVTRLVTVLVDERGLVVKEACAKDGDDTGVGIEDGLPRSVGTGVAERNDGDARGTAPGEDESLLVEFT